MGTSTLSTTRSTSEGLQYPRYKYVSEQKTRVDWTVGGWWDCDMPTRWCVYHVIIRCHSFSGEIVWLVRLWSSFRNVGICVTFSTHNPIVVLCKITPKFCCSTVPRRCQYDVRSSENFVVPDQNDHTQHKQHQRLLFPWFCCRRESSFDLHFSIYYILYTIYNRAITAILRLFC